MFARYGKAQHKPAQHKPVQGKAIDCHFRAIKL
jgi:hypothetical protein